MKRLPTLTLLGLATISGSAFAQSSVSLYGVLDLGVRYVRSGDAHVASVATGGNDTSRLGLRGLEDLGDGLRAGFQIESGLSPDTGASSDAGRFWDRRSTVSLLGDFGELRLGRDYSPTYLGYEDYDVWSDTGISSVSKFDSSLGTARATAVRADNQLAYFTPIIGGFYGEAAVAAGEGVVGKKQAAGRAGFAAGPIDLSVSYGQTTVAAVAGDDRFRTFDIGASYDFGPVKLSGYVTQSRFAGLKVANHYVGAQVPLGQGQVKVSYLRSNRSGRSASGANTDPDDASQFALGYLYKLSKRTALYGNVARLVNQGDSALAIDDRPAPATGQDATAFEIGLRHSF